MNRKLRQLHVVYTRLDVVGMFQEIDNTYGDSHSSKAGCRQGLGSLWRIVNICISPVKETWHVPVEEQKRRLLMTQNGRLDSEVWRSQLMSKWRLPGMIFRLTHWQMIRLAVIETRALAGIVTPALICSDWESSARDWERWPGRRVKASYHQQKNETHASCYWGTYWKQLAVCTAALERLIFTFLFVSTTRSGSVEFEGCQIWSLLLT